MLALLLAAAVARSPISVTFAAQNSRFNGNCPATLKFTGTITGPPNQAVTYVFNRTINGVVTAATPVNAVFDGSGHLNIVDSFSAGNGSGADEIQVLGTAVKAKADFVVTCAAAERAMPIDAIGNKHIFVAEGTSSPNYPYPYDLGKCAAYPTSFWAPKIRADLKAAYAAEHAYLQERDKYGGVAQIGFAPELPEAACVHFTVVPGHYSDTSYPAFYVTARYFSGGPMYCVTILGGTGVPSGELHVATWGGPILSPEACAALPGAPTGPIRQVPH